MQNKMRAGDSRTEKIIATELGLVAFCPSFSGESFIPVEITSLSQVDSETGWTKFNGQYYREIETPARMKLGWSSVGKNTLVGYAKVDGVTYREVLAIDGGFDCLIS